MNVLSLPQQATLAKPQTPAAVQTNLQPAMVAAQSTVAVSRPLTPQGAMPTGKADASRQNQTSTQTGQSIDTTAGTSHARMQRGGLINMRI